MGAIGDPITPDIPIVGTPGPQFAEDINDILAEVVARLSAKVPLSSVSFTSDLSLAGSKILDAGYITIQGESISPVSSPVNRITTFSGDFWFVSPSGAVKITDGPNLNAAGIGGITGDYGGGNPAQFRFDDASQRYDAYDDFGTGAWAFVRSRGFDIAAGATSTVFARLLFAGASNKTYTLPAAAATSAVRPLYMDNTGAITVGHTTVPLHYAAFGATPINTSSVFTGTAFVFDFVNGGAGGITVNAATTTDSCVKGLDHLPEGLSITNIVFHLTKVGTGNTSFQFYRRAAGSATALVASGTTTTNGAQNFTVTPGSPEVIAANTSYWVRWFPSGGANGGETWHGFTLNATYPA